jgi:DNA-binding NtrC family response regulator
MEERYIQRVLEHVGGSKVKAAALLGIDPSTLYRRRKGGKG